MGCLEYRKKIIISGNLIETIYSKIPLKTGFGRDSLKRVVKNELFEKAKEQIKELNEKEREGKEDEYKEKYNKFNQIRAKENLKRLIMCNYDQRTTFLTLTFDALGTDKRFFRNTDLDAEGVKDVSYCMQFIKKFFKRLNYRLKKAPYNRIANTKYLCVPERQKNGNFHFHICLFDVPFIFGEDFHESWGYGSYKPERFVNRDRLYNYVSKQLISYVSKNLKDDNEDLNKKAYTSSTNLKQPKEYFYYCNDFKCNKGQITVSAQEEEIRNYVKANNKRFERLVKKISGRAIKEVSKHKKSFVFKYYNAQFHNPYLTKESSKDLRFTDKNVLNIFLMEKENEIIHTEYLCLHNRDWSGWNSSENVQLFSENAKEFECEDDKKGEYIQSVSLDNRVA